MAKKETPESPKAPKGPEETSQPEKETGAEPAEISKDAKNMAMLCHLLAIFTSFVAPLIIWLIKKDEEPFVDQQGKEALNFQITIILAMFAAGLLSFICIGVLLLFAIPVVDLVFCIIASVKASNGVAYRYPVSLRLVK
jgi:uncharacterized Tic20 family protein